MIEHATLAACGTRHTQTSAVLAPVTLQLHCPSDHGVSWAMKDCITFVLARCGN